MSQQLDCASEKDKRKQETQYIMSISFQNQNSDVIWGEHAEMHQAHASAISHHACLDTIPFISLGLSFAKHSPGRN